MDLANQPLLNDNKWLFGDDLSSIASKEAELARGLAKNLPSNLPKTNLSTVLSALNMLGRRQWETLTFQNIKSSIIRAEQGSEDFHSPGSRHTAGGINKFLYTIRNLTSEYSVLAIVTGFKIPIRCVPFETSPQITQTECLF